MELILTNKDGQTLDLLNNDSRFVLSKCDGLHGVDVDFLTAENPYLDGVEIEGVKANPRGISMTFTLTPDVKESIDFFTSIVKSKQFVTLTEKEGDREIAIKGVAYIPPYTRMMAACKIDLEIYCGQPYWEDLEQIVGDISMVLPRLYFPMGTGQYFTQEGRVFSVLDTSFEKTFTNGGDVAVGMNITITALGQIQNPTIYCSTGSQHGWFMRLNLTLEAGDVVEINTERGNKYIKINGSETYDGQPVLSYLEFNGDDWLQLETGENTFNIQPESADVYFTITYRRRWE